ncbi:MAG: flagellar protein FlaG [Methylotenera sp.]
MFNTSLDAYGSGNRPVAVQNFAENQNAVVSPAGAPPLTPSGLKPVGKAEGQQPLENKQPAEVNRAELDAAVKKLNELVSPSLQAVEFSVDQESDRMVVKVVDTETKATLRQIPNAEVLAISKTLDRLQGLVIRQTA